MVSEYWVIAFFGPKTNKSIIYRQFLAAGYYDAYDKVLTFAEKTYYEVLWFKEKRKCGSDLYGKVLIDLEHICTFCNKEFNTEEPLRCNFDPNVKSCNAEFCSLQCKEEHFYLKHIKNPFKHR